MKKLIFITTLLMLGCADFLHAQKNSFYEESHQKHRKVIPLQYVREDDVIWRWRVWREINFGEKINQYFYYPQSPAQGRVNFMTMLDQAVLEGTIPAYGGQDDDCLTPRTIEELTTARSTQKATTMPSEDDPDVIIDTFYVETLDINDVRKLRVKEDWFIDKQRGVQDVRILSICPVLYRFRDGEDEPEIMPLYWVKFEDCRPIFVENEAYNMFNNDVQRLSYDDIFMKRLFASVVIKESNVMDRRINDYTEGLDALLEAEKVKEKVFEREQAMWEY